MQHGITMVLSCSTVALDMHHGNTMIFRYSMHNSIMMFLTLYQEFGLGYHGHLT